MEAVAVRDAEGNLSWFFESDAESWSGTTLQCDTLYRIKNRWVLRPVFASLNGEPAKYVGDAEALEWLIANGHKLPADLAEFAEARRLVGSDAQPSKKTPHETGGVSGDLNNDPTLISKPTSPGPLR